ncbi:MAG: phage terminase large subunit family protein [Patescibacteria group bacterium]|nr:phage terminase large subunit family protein [Patescibacteria group bacterium]
MPTVQTNNSNPERATLLGYLVESAGIIERLEPELAIALFQHRSTRGEDMTLGDKPWLLDIYRDHSPLMVIIKSVQCGVTEYAIVKLMQKLRMGRSVLYVLPTLEVRNDVVNNRIDRLLSDVPFYKAGCIGTDNTGLKFIFNGVVKFVGSNVRMGFKEFPADDLIVDEFDECDQDNLAMAYDRLASAKNPTILKIANPTVSGCGIHAEYEKSDKKEWHIKCPACNEWQPLDWFVNFVHKTDDNSYLPVGFSSLSSLESVLFAVPGGDGFPPHCRRCNKPLDRHSVGQWVAEQSGCQTSGYHISKLFTNQITTDELWRRFQEALINQTKKQLFYNSELGLPYTGEGDQLTFTDLDKCKGDYLMGPTASWSVMGVDVGAVLHVAIDDFVENRRRALFRGIVPDWEELERVRQRFNSCVGVIDALPEIHKAREYAKKHGRFFVCEYTKEGRTGGDIINRDDHILKANRTESLDDMVAGILSQRVMYPKNVRSLGNGDFARHMMASTRVLDMKRKPVPVFVWTEGGQPDHFFHAENYVHMAAKIAGWGRSAYEVKWA